MSTKQFNKSILPSIANGERRRLTTINECIWEMTGDINSTIAPTLHTNTGKVYTTGRVLNTPGKTLLFLRYSHAVTVTDQ